MTREKILIVDDEKVVRDIFVATFFDDYKIIPVATAEEALAILRRPNDIDLIVLDAMMPGMKGIELLAQIKKIDPRHKVVILTGHSSQDLAIKALRAGANDFIEKPFEVIRLKQVFERLLEMKERTDEDGLNNTERKICQAKKFIKRNCNKPISLVEVSKEVFLSPKYFSRVFKTNFGKGFNEYKKELRIEMARDLLRKKSYTVSQIAYQVGYQNPESFMKMFKKYARCTPSQYRLTRGNN